ncbi:MAG: hypothetical protein WC376_01230 [Candidatus Nanoarchaeia archaeon]
MLNYSGEELYFDYTGYCPGQMFIIDDIDYDGLIEIINIDNEEIANIRQGMMSASNNIWNTFNHDNARTGYQD